MSAEETSIVVVDDDYDSLEIIRRILERSGYKVSCFLDPMEALEQMAAKRPHLVITDLIMGSIGAGFSFSRQIKFDSRFKNIPIILVTAAYSQWEYAVQPRSDEDLKKMGIDAYFDKPVSPERLLEKVRELTQRTR